MLEKLKNGQRFSFYSMTHTLISKTYTKSINMLQNNIYMAYLFKMPLWFSYVPISKILYYRCICIAITLINSFRFVSDTTSRCDHWQYDNIFKYKKLALTACFLAICITVFQVTSFSSFVWVINIFSLDATRLAMQW